MNYGRFTLGTCLVFLCTHIISGDSKKEDIETAKASRTAVDAYIYGYPLVSMAMTCWAMTNTESSNLHAPMGHFAHARKFISAGFNDVTAPNADTLYSTAWLDLSHGVYLLDIPNNDHFFLLEFLSAWTEVFASLGTRTIGQQGGRWAIVGPNWNQQLPGDIPTDKIIRAPTNLIWILGRIYCDATEHDYATVHALQDKCILTPWPKSDRPNLYRTDRAVHIDAKKPVRDQVNSLSAQDFFNIMAILMQENPPAEIDKKLIDDMASLGIMPGKQFNLDKQSDIIAKAVAQAPQIALKKIQMYQKEIKDSMHNGWFLYRDLGTYGTRYLLRAYIAYAGLGANLAIDALYPYTAVDNAGNPLNGNNQYVLHFTKDEIPPVHGFWSITMYDDKYFFADNSINRYSIGNRDQLKFNQDGSLDIYIQHAQPDKDKITNWLPAPNGNFILMMRLYWPDQPIISGAWTPPTVKRIQEK